MSWKIQSAILIGSLLIGSGCSKKTVPSGTQQATVSLKDGSSFAGVVTSSSPGAITLQSASGETRTYPMAQVGSIQYDQPSPAASLASPQQAVAPQATAPAQIPPPAPAASNPPPVVAQPPVQSAPPSAIVENTPPPIAAPAPIVPAAVFRTVPAGNSLTVRTNETIDSKTAGQNQTFSGVIADNVLDSNGRVAIPRGSSATLIVRSVEGQGKMQGQSELALDMESVRVGTHHYRLETADIIQSGKQGLGTNKRTAKFLGGGAALGSIIGAIAGGGKGAGIGALAGAGAGTVTQGVTRGKGVNVPAETLLTFRLEAPVRIREVP